MAALMVLPLVLGYAAIAVVIARLAAGHYAWALANRPRPGAYCRDCYERATTSIRNPSTEQWFGAVVLGLVVGSLWPFGVVFLVRLPWAIGAEAEARQGALRARVEQLEEELELERTT